jgi:hypothetical protein
MEEEIEIYSEEVQDIFETSPNWLVRNSTLSIFFLLTLLVGVTLFVRYPEVVTFSEFKIESANPSFRYVTKSSGRLELLVKNNQLVDSATEIFYINSGITYENYKILLDFIDTTTSALNKGLYDSIKLLHYDVDFGVHSSTYAQFVRSIEALRSYGMIEPDLNKMKGITKQLNDEMTIIEKKKDELSKIRESLNLSKSILSRKQLLFEKGMIPLDELNQIKKEIVDKEREILNIQTNIEVQKSQLTGFNNQSDQLGLNRRGVVEEYTRSMLNTFMGLKSEVSKYKDEHLYLSPYKGVVDFVKIWSDNHNILSGEHIITLNPLNRNTIGIGMIPGNNKGKIELNQKVLIKLAAYPSIEYGTISGKVKNVSKYPTESGHYIVEVALSDEVNTSQNKKIVLTPGLSGTGEIILKEQSMFQLFFKKILRALEYENI